VTGRKGKKLTSSLKGTILSLEREREGVGEEKK